MSGAFETEFLDYLQATHAGILAGIRETKDLPEDAITALKDAIEDFRRAFETAPAACWSATRSSRRARARRARKRSQATAAACATEQ